MAEKTVGKVRAAIRRDRDLIKKAEGRIVENLKLAIELGAGAPELAEDADYTVSRIGQLVGGVRKVRKAAGTPAPKRRKAAKPQPQTEDQDQDPAPEQDDDRRPSFTPGAVDRVRQLGHAGGLVTDRWAKPREERPTLFLDVDTGEWWTAAGATGRIEWREQSAAEVLAGVPAATERVYVVGPHRPGCTPDRIREYGDTAKAARGWYMEPVPEGWTGSHYLADDKALVGHWTHTDGRKLEVQSADTWFGAGDYSAAEAAQAWHALRTMLNTHIPGAVLMSTPSTTGREAWRRTIPAKSKGYPVLSDELRELIHHTSGQGRRELVRSEPVGIGLVTQYDMRIAYAALTWGMPVGLPTLVNRGRWEAMSDDEQAKTLQRRGRWFVQATVPTGWDRVGILPHLSPDGWVWPATPGTTFKSWASAWEVTLARHHGWRVDVMEGLHFAEGKPLNAWRDALMKIWAQANSAPPEAGRVPRLVKAAVRNMLLNTLGAFASRVRPVTHTTADVNALPADAPVREVGGQYVWEAAGERSEWTERASHPEWAAEVWARCRTRLLHAPGVGGEHTGALHVPPGSVIGLSTDGLTLVGDPGWADDGAPGRYRLTGRARGAFTWPQSDGAWQQLKRTVEGAYETGEMQ